MIDINGRVETLNSNFERLRDVLGNMEQHSQIALTTFVDEQYKKVLLLAVASGFEAQLTEVVRIACRYCIMGSYLRSDAHPLMDLVEHKVISREYFRWFSWDKQNANSFFSMFGKGFSDYAQAEVRRDSALRVSIQSFMTIGRERNNLVHKDFASFDMELSARDIYELYKKARFFVTWVPSAIRRYLDECGYPYVIQVADTV